MEVSDASVLKVRKGSGRISPST